LCRYSLMYVDMPDGLNRVLPLHPFAHMKPALLQARSHHHLSSTLHLSSNCPYLHQLSYQFGTECSCTYQLVIACRHMISQ
jgi:hypothetical protein